MGKHKGKRKIMENLLMERKGEMEKRRKEENNGKCVKGKMKMGKIEGNVMEMRNE